MFHMFCRELRENRVAIYAFLALVMISALAPGDFNRAGRGVALLFAMPLLACTLGAKLFAPELAEERLEHLMVLPTPRWKMFMGKVLAGSGAMAVVALLTVPILFGTAHRIWGRSIYQECAMWTTGVVLLYALATLFSMVCHSAQTATMAAYFTGVIAATFHSCIRHHGTIQAVGLSYRDFRLPIILGTGAVFVLLATMYVLASADLFDVHDRRRRAALGFVIALAGAACVMSTCYLAW